MPKSETNDNAKAVAKYTAETKVTSGNENDVALRRGEETHWQYALKPGARSRTGGDTSLCCNAGHERRHEQRL
ncbi:hypothetical protein APHNP_0472 [Anaplasma phagocytophilum str. ApNP]|uniref:Uncharacterized protein n=1 Tax=Anaplasma phagocytophilum str. ApNP TaxID=1359153 RepID=A0A0F3NEL6_ANAPH|nr:hypothetical protein APHNP_0472 [Anaplasma phagocytophilum str. ApNP]